MIEPIPDDFPPSHESLPRRDLRHLRRAQALHRASQLSLLLRALPTTIVHLAAIGMVLWVSHVFADAHGEIGRFRIDGTFVPFPGTLARILRAFIILLSGLTCIQIGSITYAFSVQRALFRAFYHAHQHATERNA